MSDSEKRIGVTLIVGFLGSGKTTLVNQLIKNNCGYQLALIENEFGELGIDSEFIPNVEDLVLEMNDGCLCCSVRGDMVKALKNLINQEQGFDHLIIEATGVASPGPILESFKKSRELEENFEINTVISLVDADHFDVNYKRDFDDDESNFSDQLAFSDLILLNKIENKSEEELSKIEGIIHSITPEAEIKRTTFSKVEPSKIFERKFYDPRKIEDIKIKEVSGEPFLWSGQFNLPIGKHFLYFNHIHHPVKFGFIGLDAKSINKESLSLGRMIFSDKPENVVNLGKVKTGSLYETEASMVEVHVLKPGEFGLFLSDHPTHLQMELRIRDKVLLPSCENSYKKMESHSHGKINSVSIELPGNLDSSTFQFFLNSLFMKYPQRIYRTKGILSFPGNPNKVFFQGVYESFDFLEGPLWGESERGIKLVFIGKGLNADLIRSGVRNCLL
ncbi:MAG: GTP-binding protein [Bacteriovoracaceae bacterium]|nr:GTP-binding protein [Bacteriovoracaceae bacterium]